MGKHEIRFRRKQMTGRMIERHKDYESLRNQHHRKLNLKKWLRWWLILFATGAFLYLAFTLLSKQEKQKNRQNNNTEIGLNSTAENL